MYEVTRTISIQITGICNSKDVREDTASFTVIPKEYVESQIRDIFKDADQIIVDIKDFIREDAE